MSNTTNYGWPVPQAGQVDKLTPVQQALSQADADLKALDDAKAKNYGRNSATGVSSTDWYTILSNAGTRFMTSLVLNWTRGGYHGYATIIFSGSYGYDPVITVTNFSLYSGATMPRLRVRYNSTYDGYLVQVKSGQDATAFVYDVLYNEGADLRPFVPDVNSQDFAGGTLTKTVELDLKTDRALQTSQNICVSNGKDVWHAGNTLIDPTTGCIAPA